MIFENTGKKRWNELDDNTKGLLLLAYHEGKTLQEWWPNENEWEDFSLATDGYYPEWNLGILRIKPEPAKQVHWCNDYENGFNGWWHKSRELANANAKEKRIALIRREIVDGVVSYYREDV